MYEAGWFESPMHVYSAHDNKFPPLNKVVNGIEYMMGYVIIEAIKDQWGFDTVIALIKKRGDIKAVLNMEQEQFEKIIYDRIYDKYIKK